MDSHRTDPFSLITGVLFLVIGLIALVGDVALDDVSGEWLGPVLLGAAGVALLASVPLRRARPEPSPVSSDRGPDSPADNADVDGADELADEDDG